LQECYPPDLNIPAKPAKLAVTVSQAKYLKKKFIISAGDLGINKTISEKNITRGENSEKNS